MSETATNIDHAHDDHDHDHPWFLGHHWENPNQQFEAGKLGMWLFLATEVLLFGGLFCGYAIWRGNHPELFKFGSQYLDTTLGAVNTAVLIASSLTMAWGVTAAQQGKKNLLMLLLGITLAGAVTFLVIKYFEYTHKFHEGIFPGIGFYEKPGEDAHSWNAGQGAFVPLVRELPVAEGVPDLTMPPSELTTVAPASEGPAGFNVDALDDNPGATHAEATAHAAATDDHAADAGADDHAEDLPTHHLQDPLRPRDAHMFFNIYFMMTGLHGIHVLAGMGVISWLLFRAWKGEFGPDYFTPVDLGGLYWHVVDLIWIFLFPLFYLI